jgi:type II secretory pathway component PulM
MNRLQVWLSQQNPQHVKQGGLVMTTLVLLLVGYLLWHWQETVDKNYVQAQQQQHQLLTIAQGLPIGSAKRLQGDDLLQQIAAQPLTGLSGKVTNLRLVGQKVSAKVEQASIEALLAWLGQLEQQGVVVSGMTLSQPTQGVVSGQLIWGQE